MAEGPRHTGGRGGVRLADLRGHNTALVLDLVRGAGRDGISRPELALRTGLTVQAVSKITGRLREAGLLAAAGRQESTGGKPATALRLVREAVQALGVHLDRDGVLVVRTDLTGRALARRRVPLDLGRGAREVVDVVAGAMADVLAGEDGRGEARGVAGGVTEVGDAGGVAEVGVAGGVTGAGHRGAGGTGARAVGDGDARAAGDGGGSARAAAEGGEPPLLLGAGLAAPGPLDHRTGVLHKVSGFSGLDGLPLAAALSERLGLPVVLDKDTNAAALGRALAGDARAFAYLHLGTGLGAGLVLDGRLYRGPRTGAGELGHQVVRLDGPPCVCGNRGCVEALCLAALAAGDTAEAARVLGTAAANLVGLLDVELVLLGGHRIAAAPEAFVRGVTAALDARASRTGTEPVRVRAAAGASGAAGGGDGAIAEGAAQLVLAPLFGRLPAEE
ncbi:ROK family transcriptional regulator [Streptomyces sp. DSM 41982]|uniref:ROK family transcriptional regulator n=1 Tax=Streptomyces evansiae TaxID=3075535 RepID=A0ABD5E857_9ACTN|nr:ROK family transcriptional regulator [Streptomyces sp. DSM 41982]MDT0417606.1 ROK family transcriptional regulator [Streptomyces sp. DSM 41982]